MPLVIMMAAILFNLANGFFLGYYFAHFADYPSKGVALFPVISGIILFMAGLLINWYHDTLLIRLRKPGETGYKIPHGGLFKYISCPNHFGEIIEWSGFALMCFNLPALAFLIWTAANLVPRALSHHRWYKEHFEEYPEDRKAVIPFVL